MLLCASCSYSSYMIDNESCSSRARPYQRHREFVPMPPVGSFLWADGGREHCTDTCRALQCYSGGHAWVSGPSEEGGASSGINVSALRVGF